MNIEPRAGILLIRKHNRTALKHDIAVEEADEDKRLITGTVLNGSDGFDKGSTVIFGKYALYKLAVQGEDYYLLDVADVLGTCDYQEA
jgi:co-chaperonin GroES (HSP10)